jgi:hypothetical protein
VDFFLWNCAQDRAALLAPLTAWKRAVLRFQGLSDADDWFLTTHGEQVQSWIQDPFLRSLPPLCIFREIPCFLNSNGSMPCSI